MEAMDERRVWQRVRGMEDRAGELRGCLAAQGELLGMYRVLSRRGGKGRQLFEQKRDQIACLRGLLRVLTGQSVAPPRCPEAAADLLRCHSRELEFLRQLKSWSREEELGPVFDSLAHRQQCQCRLILELVGTM